MCTTSILLMFTMFKCMTSQEAFKSRPLLTVLLILACTVSAMLFFSVFCSRYNNDIYQYLAVMVDLQSHAVSFETDESSEDIMDPLSNTSSKFQAPDTYPYRIFQVGLNKCGTGSIHRFFQSNKVPSHHYYATTVNVFPKALSQGNPMLTYLNNFMACQYHTHIKNVYTQKRYYTPYCIPYTFRYYRYRYKLSSVTA